MAHVWTAVYFIWRHFILFHVCFISEALNKHSKEASLAAILSLTVAEWLQLSIF